MRDSRNQENQESLRIGQGYKAKNFREGVYPTKWVKSANQSKKGGMVRAGHQIILIVGLRKGFYQKSRKKKGGGVR